MPKVKEILGRVKKLELKTRKPVEGLIAGSYHSIFKGRGIEFTEVREYTPGDDIRDIDWNVTARLNTPYVKEYTEERDLDVYIVFDVSASNDFGYMKTKKELGYEIATTVMFAAIRNNDNIGLCLFTDHVEKYIKPRKGRKHALKLLRELIYHTPESRETDINASLTYLSKIIKRRGIIFILSDFLSGDFNKPLRYLKNRHDVILIKLCDIREEDIPDIGYALLEDGESGEQILVNTSAREFRGTYSKKIREKLMNQGRKMGVDMLQVNTSEPYIAPLRRYFKLREKRMR